MEQGQVVSGAGGGGGLLPALGLKDTLWQFSRGGPVHLCSCCCWVVCSALISKTGQDRNKLVMHWGHKFSPQATLHRTVLSSIALSPWPRTDWSVFYGNIKGESQALTSCCCCCFGPHSTVFRDFSWSGSVLKDHS